MPFSSHLSQPYRAERVVDHGRLPVAVHLGVPVLGHLGVRVADHVRLVVQPSVRLHGVNIFNLVASSFK